MTVVDIIIALRGASPAQLATVRALLEAPANARPAPVVTAADVRALSRATDAPLMTCKQALVLADGCALRAMEAIRAGRV